MLILEPLALVPAHLVAGLLAAAVTVFLLAVQLRAN